MSTLSALSQDFYYAVAKEPTPVLNSPDFEAVFGFEGDPPKNKVTQGIEKRDLTVPFTLNTKGNVLFLEVGEHVDAQYQDILLDNVTKHCNGYLIMSWAVRGQEGFGHVNCLDNHEVIPLIESRGFKLMEKETKEVRSIDLSEAPWFKNTLLIFKRV